MQKLSIAEATEIAQRAQRDARALAQRILSVI